MYSADAVLMRLRTGSGVFALLGLGITFTWHIAVGAKVIPLGTVAEVFFNYDDTLLTMSSSVNSAYHAR